MRPELAKTKETAELEVYRGSEQVGTLIRTLSGARFTYDREYADRHASSAHRAIAFAMAVRAQHYDVAGTNLHPFFAGLLPEGLRFRALARGLKTSEDDLFSMLVAAGGNTVGDVWVKPTGAGFLPAVPVVETHELSERSFEELLAQSLDWSQRGDATTVAGMQPKVSAAMISFPMRARRTRREYILKLSPPEYPRLVENEFFFMRLTRSMKLSTANVELVHDREGRAGLLVERFDRVPASTDKQAPMRRLHQEDACQLLDRYPADKYRLSLREISEALEVCSAPTVERLRLLQLQALAYLIGNGDLHGKNVSVLVCDGRTRLTPIYDMLSTLPYGDDHLALKMDGRDKALRRRDFIAFGERIGVRRAATERMLDALARGVSSQLAGLGEIGLEQRKARQLERTIRKHLDLVTG